MSVCFISRCINATTTILWPLTLASLLCTACGRDCSSEVFVHWILLGRDEPLCLLLSYYYVGWVFDLLSLAFWRDKLAHFQLRCSLVWHLRAWGVLRTNWLFFLQRINCLNLHGLPRSLFYLLITQPAKVARVFLLRLKVDACQAGHNLICRSAALHSTWAIALVILRRFAFPQEVTLFAHAHIRVHLDRLKVLPQLWVYLPIHSHLWSLEDVLQVLVQIVWWASRAIGQLTALFSLNNSLLLVNQTIIMRG